MPKTNSPIKPHNNACDPVPKTIARGRAQSGGDKPPTIEYSSPTFDICVGATLVLCIILWAADILGSPAPVFRCPNWIGYVSCTHVRTSARTHARTPASSAKMLAGKLMFAKAKHKHTRARSTVHINSINGARACFGACSRGRTRARLRESV